MSYNRSATAAYKDLNIVTALALSTFAVLGLVMTGLAGEVIAFLEQYRFLPMGATFASLAVVFASSGTRNPDQYHGAELLMVGVGVLLMVGMGFLTEVQTMVSSNQPWGAIVVMTVLTVDAAILSK